MKKIYVGNLSYDATEDDLRSAFGQYGEVSSVAVITDRETGRPRGFGFVEMADDEHIELVQISIALPEPVTVFLEANFRKMAGIALSMLSVAEAPVMRAVKANLCQLRPRFLYEGQVGGVIVIRPVGNHGGEFQWPLWSALAGGEQERKKKQDFFHAACGRVCHNPRESPAKFGVQETMKRGILFLLALMPMLLAIPTTEAAKRLRDFEKPPHNYWQRAPQDRFTKIKTALETGKLPLDRTSEKAFVTSLLKALDISPSTQTLVYSTTSLQLSRISPRNPRALYFNENVYVGWVPRGQIEVASIDPALGGIYYIFNVPHGPGPIRVERSTRCFNCHAEFEHGRVPGLLLKSVVPGPGGGGRGDRAAAGRSGEPRLSRELPRSREARGELATGLRGG